MYRFVFNPASPVFKMRDFAPSGIADSIDVANLVPITTPCAPRANAAIIPAEFDIPPAANTGIFGSIDNISGTRETILAELTAP
jgi:hypothetical protein